MNSKEQLLNDYIDDLNCNNKSRAYQNRDQLDDEMLDLLETVRAVKRTYPQVNEEQKTRLWGWKKYMAIGVAAVLILVLIAGLEIFIKPDGGNIVHAVMRAYGQLDTYQGQVVLKAYQGDTLEFQETVDISYKKPWKYKAIHRFEGNLVERISDGNKVISVYPNMVEIDYLYPEEHLWRYHIGTVVWELEKATEVNQLAMEKILGRDAYLIEYRLGLEGELQRMWVDAETDLPLRKELSFPEDRTMVIEFVALKVNEAISDDVFSTDIPPRRAIKEWNTLSTLGEAKERWGRLELFNNQLPKDLALAKVGKVDVNTFVLRYQGSKEDDLLDIVISPRSEFIRYQGKEGKGYVQIKEDALVGAKKLNTAHWVAEDLEVHISTTREALVLYQLLRPVVDPETEFYPEM